MTWSSESPVEPARMLSMRLERTPAAIRLQLVQKECRRLQHHRIQADRGKVEPGLMHHRRRHKRDGAAEPAHDGAVMVSGENALDLVVPR